MRFLLIFLTVTFFGCGMPCRGIYTERDSYGNLKKFNEYHQDGQCVKDTISLSQWEASSELRAKKGVRCAPQPQFTSVSLVSSNNFYDYRDGKMYLELNSSTGEYRRLIVAEGRDGNQVFTRLQGCFYQRSDVNFGDQLLLDTVDAASSQYFDAREIFTYTSTPTTMEMVRYDDSFDWSYQYCPYLDTPWGFCDLLRNGNDMFFPVLAGAEQNALLSEALLIRRQFNFSAVSNFHTVWNTAESSYREVSREEYRFAISTIVDTPRYIEQAWVDFVRGDRPIMPDITSNRIPPICYPAKRRVTLNDGSTAVIQGEVCYIDGEYVFTQ